jgi:hypothetical protein
VISIDVLPDDVLLEIFFFYMDDPPDDDERYSAAFRTLFEAQFQLHGSRGDCQEYGCVVDRFTKMAIEAWQSLVHVCRRWRCLVFESPRRLNLRLVCAQGTPARQLDVWSPFPLVIRKTNRCTKPEGLDNIVAALEHRDRVDSIRLWWLDYSQLERISAAMQESFPRLKRLHFTADSIYDQVPALPDSFLGGSAPHLRSFQLKSISFPALPKLLLSATRLVHLQLDFIPHSGYISPEAMATALSAATSLESLRLVVEYFQSHPGGRRLPPPMPIVLSVLSYFRFNGAGEYLDYLMARIDAPRLSDVDISFYDQVVIDTPQFAQFISRTPKLKAIDEARISIGDGIVGVIFSSYGYLQVTLPVAELNWQVSSLERLCARCLPPLSMLEDLYITHDYPDWQRDWQDNSNDTLWLALLCLFPAVTNLYLCEEFAECIVPVLEELAESRTTEVLPTLQNIFLDGLVSWDVREGIEEFVSGRQDIGQTIVVSHWDRDDRDRSETSDY